MNTKDTQQIMAKVEFGFGVGFDYEQQPLTEGRVNAALSVIRREAVTRFGAYTLTPVKGGWTNPQGVLVEEPGYTLTIMLDAVVDRQIQSMACFIGGALNQEAIVVTMTPVDFRVIYMSR